MLWNNFKVAFAMYSKIPVPQADWEKENMKYALCFFPWIGIVIGILEWGWYGLSCYLGTGELFRAAGMTLIPVFVTGGIHLDGFLDTMDALSSWREKERRLEILKDPHAGAFAIIMGGVYFTAYLGGASGITADTIFVYGLGFGMSRAFSGLSLLYFPNANPKGTAAAFGKSASKQKTKAALSAELVLFLIAAGIVAPFYGIAVAAVSFAVFGYYYRKSMKYFGGITGDLAGYFLSLCELMQVLVLSFVHLGLEKWL